MGRTPHLNPPPKARARDQSPDAPRRRGRPPTPPWPGVDWSLPDAEIARRRGVSREAVRVARIRYNAGPAWSKPGVAFRAYARENRVRLHGKPASEALAAAGVRLYGATARRILREAGVRVAREPQPSKLRGADWRLPNPDLARIRGLSRDLGGQPPLGTREAQGRVGPAVPGNARRPGLPQGTEGGRGAGEGRRAGRWAVRAAGRGRAWTGPAWTGRSGTRNSPAGWA